MPKSFNIIGVCIPELHYMVNTQNRIKDIATNYIANGCYFTINRARQFGKTTTLYLLEKYLKEQYVIIRLSFEIADELFNSLYSFSKGLVYIIYNELKNQGIDKNILDKWNQPVSHEFPFNSLSRHITELCKESNKKIILMIDEIDKSSDNQIFLSFLGLLRNKYLEQQQQRDTTFQSVILAGVYDIKNLKLKLHPGDEPKYNIPWNIASDFMVDMCFYPEEIPDMLSIYEEDFHTGMDIKNISSLIYEYTCGYPYMVSRICFLIDKYVAGSDGFPGKKEALTTPGFLKAIRNFLQNSNTLFDDMSKKLDEFPVLKERISDILFYGAQYTFEANSPIINIGIMFGFLKNSGNLVVVANHIFETKIYNILLSEKELAQGTRQRYTDNRKEFIQDGKLNMHIVMEKFLEYYEEIFGNTNEKFLENEGRRIFLMYLRSIINGSGNYYIETQTHDQTRTDIIVDYEEQRFIIEMKLWHGNAYNKRGEEQLAGYLDFYKQDIGYLLSFNSNKNKKTGIKEITINNKKIIEIVV